VEETADAPRRDPDGDRIRELIRQRHDAERLDDPERIAEIDRELEHLGVRSVPSPGTRGPQQGPARP
jgi:hypothetical protein